MEKGWHFRHYCKFFGRSLNSYNIIFVPQDRYRLFLYSLDETNKKLKRILNLLDWSKGFDVSSVCQRHLPAVLQVIEKKRLPVTNSFVLNFHYLPKEEAVKFDTT